MTAPTFVAAGASAANLSAITVNYPTGWANGDVLLLFVQTSNQGVTAPTGWTELTSSPQGTGTGGNAGSVGLSAFWRVAQTGDSGSVSVADGGNHQYGVIVAYRGVDTSGATPFDVTPVGGVQSTATTSGATGTSVTTSTADAMVVVAFADAYDSILTSFSSWANSNLTSVTERFDDGGTSVGTGGGVGIADGVMASAGAVGSTTVTITQSTNTTKTAFMTVPLKAAAGGPANLSSSASDNAAASDAVVRSAQTFSRSTADNAAASEAVARASAFSRTVADNAAASDGVSRTSSRSRSASDNAAASDVVARSAQAFSRSISDDAAASDAVSTGGGTNKAGTDAGTGADSASAIATIVDADSGSGADTATASADGPSLASDTATGADSAALGSATTAAGETASGADVASVNTGGVTSPARAYVTTIGGPP